MKMALRTFVGIGILIGVLTGAAYGAKMEGTYTSPAGGVIALDLRPGGKANFTLMGENHACTYKVKGDKLMLDCTPKGEKVDFTIHDDGSLSGPGFIGNLRKSK
jgi:hypothetical protein